MNLRKTDGELLIKSMSVASNRIDEFNGRTITIEESEILKETLNIMIPQWFINILLDFPLTGCYFKLSEALDISGIGVDMQWMTPTQTISESTEVYPGIAAVLVGYLPIGICMNGSGDYYFIQITNINLPLFRIPHTAVNKNGQLIEEYIELVCSSLSNFFEIVEIAK